MLAGRGGGEDIDSEYWLNLIRSFGTDTEGNESPVVVVMNKIGEHPFQLDQRGLRAKFPSIRRFLQTDCAEGIGLDELKAALQQETDHLEHLRDAFPSSWFAIKERLAGMKENYLSFDQFRELCRTNGESAELAQEQLASYLHSLGIALNYKDDPRLRDMHVLNPHWVTNGIYKILNSEMLAKSGGVLEVGELGRELDAKEYPRPMHQFLVDLMRKFELGFPFPDEEARYLVPELLGKEQPELDNLIAADPLRFEYHYPVLPEGLLPRFIVRTRAQSKDLPRWRTGVVLKLEANQAAVVADIVDRKVRIMVGGPVPGRRRLLAVIRSHLEHIHESIKSLKPIEMVPLPGARQVQIPYQKLRVLEDKGRTTYDELVGDDLVTLNVRELLDGVDLEGTRRRPEIVGEERRVRVFISYSHKDEMLKNELETHLAILKRQGLIDAWSDRRIEPAENWKGRIDKKLNDADVIILLISADFIASDYCHELEMGRGLERQKAGEAELIPIIVRDLNWKSAAFARVEVLPKDGKAVTTWADRDSAWRNVSEGIERVVNKVRLRLRPT